MPDAALPPRQDDGLLCTAMDDPEEEFSLSLLHFLLGGSLLKAVQIPAPAVAVSEAGA